MDSTIDNADVNRNQTFFFNLGAWPRSYNNPLEEAKKHLLKCKWKLTEDRNSSCCFEKQSTHLYVHFLGFAVATGPDVSTDEVIANCGTKWLGNTSLPGREVKKQKIDGNNWEEFFSFLLSIVFFSCPLSFSHMGVGERERSGWFRRANLLADDGDGSEFLEVPPAHVSFRPGPEFSELPAIGCLTSVSACFVCSHDSSPGLSGPFAAASWSMAGSGSGTFDWMLGNSRSSRFGTGVSSESTPSR